MRSTPLLLLFFVFLCVEAVTFPWGGHMNETHFRPAKHDLLEVAKVQFPCLQVEVTITNEVTIMPELDANGMDTANCLISDFKDKDCLGINDDPKSIATQAICASAFFILERDLNILVPMKGAPCMTIDKNGHFLSNITSSCDKESSIQITSCFIAWKMFILHDVITIRNCSDNDTLSESSTSADPPTNYANLDMFVDDNNKAFFRPTMNFFAAREEFRDICESVDGLSEAQKIQNDPPSLENNVLCSFDDFNETDCVQDVTIGYKTRTRLICETMEYIEYQRDFLEISNYELRSMPSNVNGPCIDFGNGKVTVLKEICDHPMSIVHANCWIAWKKHVILDKVDTIKCEDLPPRPTTTSTTTTSTTSSTTTSTVASISSRTTSSEGSSTEPAVDPVIALTTSSFPRRKSTRRPKTTASAGNGSAIREGTPGSTDSQEAKKDGGGGYKVWPYVVGAVIALILLCALLAVAFVFIRKWLKKRKESKGKGKSTSAPVISTLPPERITPAPLKKVPAKTPVVPKKDPSVADLEPKHFEEMGILTVEGGIKGPIVFSEESSHSLLDAWVDDKHKVYFIGSDIEKVEESPSKMITCTEGETTAARTARQLKSTKTAKGASESKKKKIQVRRKKTKGKK